MTKEQDYIASLREDNAVLRNRVTDLTRERDEFKIWWTRDSKSLGVALNDLSLELACKQDLQAQVRGLRGQLEALKSPPHNWTHYNDGWNKGIEKAIQLLGSAPEPCEQWPPVCPHCGSNHRAIDCRTQQPFSQGASRDASTLTRPSPPPATSRYCVDCDRIKDDSGETFGWALCHCGSFRQPEKSSAKVGVIDDAPYNLCPATSPPVPHKAVQPGVRFDLKPGTCIYCGVTLKATAETGALLCRYCPARFMTAWEHEVHEKDHAQKSSDVEVLRGQESAINDLLGTKRTK